MQRLLLSFQCTHERLVLPAVCKYLSPAADGDSAEKLIIILPCMLN